MKLRSIILAGLLGTSLLTMSGCKKDDVKDAIDDLVKPNAVYVVNGYGSPITAHADSDFADLDVNKIKVFALTGDDTTEVYYSVNNNHSVTTSFNYGNAYLYVASSQCNLEEGGFGKMIDHSTGTGIVKVVNATNIPLTADTTNTVTLHVTNDGSTVDKVLTLESGTIVAGCAQVASTINIADLGIRNGSDVSVTIGSTTSDSYHVGFDIPTTVDVDIIYLGGEDAVAVPLAKWDDLI